MAAGAWSFTSDRCAGKTMGLVRFIMFGVLLGAAVAAMAQPNPLPAFTYYAAPMPTAQPAVPGGTTYYFAPEVTGTGNNYARGAPDYNFTYPGEPSRIVIDVPATYQTDDMCAGRRIYTGDALCRQAETTINTRLYTLSLTDAASIHPRCRGIQLTATEVCDPVNGAITSTAPRFSSAAGVHPRCQIVLLEPGATCDPVTGEILPPPGNAAPRTNLVHPRCQIVLIEPGTECDPVTGEIRRLYEPDARAIPRVHPRCTVVLLEPGAECDPVTGEIRNAADGPPRGGTRVHPRCQIILLEPGATCDPVTGTITGGGYRSMAADPMAEGAPLEFPPEPGPPVEEDPTPFERAIRDVWDAVEPVYRFYDSLWLKPGYDPATGAVTLTWTYREPDPPATPTPDPPAAAPERPEPAPAPAPATPEPPPPPPPTPEPAPPSPGVSPPSLGEPAGEPFYYSNVNPPDVEGVV